MPRPARKGYERTTDPLRPLPITELEWKRRRERARLRVVQDDARRGVPATKTREVLEMLGLVEPPSRVSAPSGGGENGSTARSGASTRPRLEWCRRKLHRLTGDNVYTDPDGDRQCRKCRKAMRAGCDPAMTYPAEPGSPHYTPKHVDDRWCGRGLHQMIGDNVLTDRSGKRECRECRLWRRERDRARKRGAAFDEEPPA